MKTVGINHIAEKVGISRNTVSKVINGRGDVAGDTRKKIIEAAIELGYKKIKPEWQEEVNLKNVLVIATSPDFSSYWGKIINGITHRIVEEGYDCFYHFLTSEQVKEFTVPNVLKKENISGIIIMNVYEPQTIEEIGRLNIPAVYFDSPLKYRDESVKGDTILIEGRMSIAKITKQLIGEGITKIGFIGDITYCKSIYERWIGFVKTMENYQISVDERYCLISSSQGHFYIDGEVEEHLEKLLEEQIEMPKAFICANDVIAYRVINLLNKRGYNIPEDIKVSGFDDIEENMLQEKILTTVNIATEDIGIRLAEQIIWRMENSHRQYEIIKIVGEVIERLSTQVK